MVIAADHRPPDRHDAFASLFLIAERRAAAPLIAPQLLVGRRLVALDVATAVIADHSGAGQRTVHGPTAGLR
ncbi:hypothetical protein [Actinomadura sp. B10D3]|uniref:hypothetical protein n=1 Tax=Actinomadura sp. B10D3 TaxID=3153557 RepID=UPI00325F8DC3